MATKCTGQSSQLTKHGSNELEHYLAGSLNGPNQRQTFDFNDGGRVLTEKKSRARENSFFRGKKSERIKLS
jgi:hypothetical protein